LTNHRLDTESPFARIILRQPTLTAKMAPGTLAALAQRITLRRSITGITSDETPSYIDHHLKLVGQSTRCSPMTPLGTSAKLAAANPSRQPARHRRLRRRQEPRRRRQRTNRSHRNQQPIPARDALTSAPHQAKSPAGSIRAGLIHAPARLNRRGPAKPGGGAVQTWARPRPVFSESALNSFSSARGHNGQCQARGRQRRLPTS
jgi:hypothetical protein